MTLIGTAVLDGVRRRAEARDAAVALYLELADRAARCCFDFDYPWRHYLPSGDASKVVANRDARDVVKFRPTPPVFYPSMGSKVALLAEPGRGDLVRFYSALDRWRRELDDIDKSKTPSVGGKDLVRYARRLGESIPEAKKAIASVSVQVEGWEDIERRAFEGMYRTARDADRTARLKIKLKDNLKPGLKAARLLAKEGGVMAVARRSADAAVDAIYRASYVGVTQPAVPMVQPYIFSFCSHVRDKPHVRSDGLLSQWRGYGGSQGYALVFDTAALADLLQREGDFYAYTSLFFTPVVYDDAQDKIPDEFTDLVQLIVDLAWEMGAERRADLITDKFIKEFLISSCTFKHYAFQEEREIRIVACPLSAEVREKYKSTGKADSQAHEPLKPICHRPSADRAPFIKLFDFPGRRRLPIKRIIVGPHHDQDSLVSRVRSLVGSKLPVERSRTPLRLQRQL